VPAVNSSAPFVANRLDMAMVGVEVPVGAFTYGATYIQTAFKGPAGESVDYRRVGFAGTYYLSKRTSLYAGITLGAGDLASYVLEKRVIQAGINHSL
jgi:predicted porin